MRTSDAGLWWVRRMGFAVVAAGVLLAAAGVSMSPASANHNGGQVTICHATNSNANPYVQTTVDEATVDGLAPPNGDHFLEHVGPVWDPTLKALKIEWGDIIPPVAGHHAGLNWDAAGQALYNAGCTPAAPVPTGAVSLAKVTTGPNAPADGTSFAFTVVCESGNVPSSPVNIASNQPAVSAATGVADGDTCTITETTPLGATSTVFTVNGVAQPAGTQVIVTVAGAATAAVVATNSFPVIAPIPPVPPVTGDVTLAKVTTGPDAPAAGTSFTFTVACQSGTVPTSPVQIASGQAASVVASGVVVGDTCTITETVTNGAASTVFTVNGVAQPAGTQVIVTVASAAGVTVSASNAFPAVAVLPGVIVNPGPITPPATAVTPPVVTPPVAAPIVAPSVVTPPVVTPPVVASAVTPPSSVGGEVRAKALPQTGTTTLPLLETGSGLILLGVGALLFGRERTALI